MEYKRMEIMSHYSIVMCVIWFVYCLVVRRDRATPTETHIDRECVLVVEQPHCVEFADWMRTWIMSPFQFHIYFVDRFLFFAFSFHLFVFWLDGIYLELERKPIFQVQLIDHVEINWTGCVSKFTVWSRKKSTNRRNIRILNECSMRHVFFSWQ